jgi:hypothetical protein
MVKKISWSVCPLKIFQPSLKKVNARAYPKGVPQSIPIIWKSWKNFPGTNTLAYFVFITSTLRRDFYARVYSRKNERLHTPNCNFWTIKSRLLIILYDLNIFGQALKYLFSYILSPCDNGRIQILNLRIMSQVFCHCAALLSLLLSVPAWRHFIHMLVFIRCHDNQYDDTHYDDGQHNHTQHHQHNGTARLKICKQL